MKALLLGGCGAQGIFAARALVEGSVFDEIVIADIDLAKAEKAARELDSPKVSTVQVDIFDRRRLVSIIKNADIAVNCTGPFYLIGPEVVEAAIEAGTDYVDICDDIEAHEKVFTYSKQAADKGITVLLGLDCSPGIVSLLAMHAAGMMDQVEDIQIILCINDAEPEGAAVVYHFLGNLVGMMPLLKDGELVYEQPFENEELVDFGGPVGRIKVTAFRHSEIFTLPRAIKGLRNLSVKLGIYPSDNYELLKLFSQIGLGSTMPIQCKGQEVVPRDFIVSYIQFLKELLGSEPGSYDKSFTIVDVKGSREGEWVRYRYSMTGKMGPATGIPVAIGAEMIARKEITAKGVLSPEESITPKPFIDEVLSRMGPTYTFTVITEKEWK